MNVEQLGTEQRNTRTMDLDLLSTGEILQLMNQEDQQVPAAIRLALAAIEDTVQAVIHSFQAGGRLIYIGAGTSGRLGVLDAAECVPTFGVSPEMVMGLIAGGEEAMTKAVEGAEDSPGLAVADLAALNLSELDTLVGIAASGRTPYVIGALDYARQVGATAVSLACNVNAEISQHSDIAIEVDCGPEILTGSTRLKAGSAQKMILNMISTASMIGIGKIYQNLMVDVQPTNEKLIKRSINIIMAATECDRATAEHYFEEAHRQVKVAIVMILTQASRAEATAKLTEAKGFIRNTQDK